jgi:hypothetical protein
MWPAGRRRSSKNLEHADARRLRVETRVKHGRREEDLGADVGVELGGEGQKPSGARSRGRRHEERLPVFLVQTFWTETRTGDELDQLVGGRSGGVL